MKFRHFKWIYAQLFLASVGFVHYARKFWPWSDRTPGIEQFKRNYFSESFLPCTQELRAIAHEPGRCTTCGQCDFACPENLSPMRSLLKPERALREMASCTNCHACEQACPQRIPILRYVHLASKTFHPGASWRTTTGS
ncbi:MAG: 4Fe-4S dicluster domain-containing protein [Myxococcaceae bacterium]|nr:4Fe-4S dicluster domain-containing protein [Myxococcaceae bacterium]MBH2005847.1 4Fe-4S dicluster domain-containing protein [Myxococcaceae bacterium]